MPCWRGWRGVDDWGSGGRKSMIWCRLEDSGGRCMILLAEVWLPDSALTDALSALVLRLTALRSCKSGSTVEQFGSFESLFQ